MASASTEVHKTQRHGPEEPDQFLNMVVLPEGFGPDD